MLIPDLKIKVHRFYNSEPARIRERTQVIWGSWPGPVQSETAHPAGGTGNGGGVPVSRYKDLGRVGYVCALALFSFLFS